MADLPNISHKLSEPVSISHSIVTETAKEVRRQRDRARYKGDRAVRARKRAAEYYVAHREVALRKMRLSYRRRLRFVGAEELERYRADPSQANGIRGSSSLVCLECGQIISGMLNNAHLRGHYLTEADYKARWNWSGALVSDVMAQKLRNRRRRGGVLPADNPLRATAGQLSACRQDPRKARDDDKTTCQGKFIVCLECGAMLRHLRCHLRVHKQTPQDYRKRWGYARGSALCSNIYSQELGARAKRQMLGRGVRISRLRTENASGTRGMKLRRETLLNRRDAQTGKSHPQQWKRLNGQFVTDTRVAELRLEGKRISDIARITGLSTMATHFRLKRMKFPMGWPHVYQHGEALNGAHLHALRSDFGKSRRELAALLGMDHSKISRYLALGRQHQPLPSNVARRVLLIQPLLRQEQRKKSPTASGGRPKLLLPTERRELPTKYHVLLRDLKLIHRFLKDQYGLASLAQVWDRVCQLRRQGEIQVLLFWPQFYRWLCRATDEQAFVAGAWVPADLALEFLADDYQAGVETIRRAVRAAHR